MWLYLYLELTVLGQHFGQVGYLRECKFSKAFHGSQREAVKVGRWIRWMLEGLKHKLTISCSLKKKIFEKRSEGCVTICTSFIVQAIMTEHKFMKEKCK